MENGIIYTTEEKMNSLRSKDYLNSKGLDKWLEIAAEIIEENVKTIEDLSAEKESYREKIVKLNKDLNNESDEGIKKDLEKEIFNLSQEADGKEIEITKYLKENRNKSDNEFIIGELKKIKDRLFLTELKSSVESASDDEDKEKNNKLIEELEETLNQKDSLIIALKERLSNATGLSSRRRVSILVSTRDPEKENKERLARTPALYEKFDDDYKAEVNGNETEKERNDVKSFLTDLKKELEESEKEKEKELFELVKKALENIDIKVGCEKLLDEWNNYSDFLPDLEDERFLLEFLVENWDDIEQTDNESVKKESGKLQLKIEDLTIQLNDSREEAKKNFQNWKEANTEFSKALTKAIKKTDEKYSNFIDPSRKDDLKKAAQDILKMATIEQVKKTVEKFKKPLKVWTDTFPDDNAESVKEHLEDILKEKEKLIENNEKLTVDLDEWKDTFYNKNAPDVKIELDTAKKDRDKWELEATKVGLTGGRTERKIAELTSKVEALTKECNRLTVERSNSENELKDSEEKIQSLENYIKQLEENDKASIGSLIIESDNDEEKVVVREEEEVNSDIGDEQETGFSNEENEEEQETFENNSEISETEQNYRIDSPVNSQQSSHDSQGEQGLEGLEGVSSFQVSSHDNSIIEERGGEGSESELDEEETLNKDNAGDRSEEEFDENKLNEQTARIEVYKNDK